MRSSKKSLTEQCRRLYARYVDRENITPITYDEEIELLVGQGLNTVLQAKTMQAQTVNQVDIPQCSLVHYDVIVTDNKFTMPAFPLNLPEDLGFWEMYDPADALKSFIPISLQTAKVMQGTIVANLESNTGVYRYGDQGFILSDVDDGTYGMWLLVADLDTLGDLDPLPITAGYEMEVILFVLRALGAGAFAQQELGSINNREELIKQSKEANDNQNDR